MKTHEITIENYGMAKGALWYQQMVDEGWLLPAEGVEVDVEKCNATVAIAEESDFLYVGDEGEEADEHEIALQLLVGLLDQSLDDWDAALKMACEFLVELSER